jgi:hypothetical protein
MFHRTEYILSPSNLALYLVKWIDTVESEQQSGILDDEELGILRRLQELVSQTDVNVKGDKLSAVVLEVGTGLLSEARVYGCMSTISTLTS